jgi:hypothetical protein
MRACLMLPRFIVTGQRNHVTVRIMRMIMMV